MKGKNADRRRVSEAQHVEMRPGLVRTTLVYNDALMLCHFTMKKGAEIPLHNHVAVQNGYMIRGAVRFFRKDGDDLIIRAGDGYLFESEEYHGSEALEESEFIECFAPMRPEYADPEP